MFDSKGHPLAGATVSTTTTRLQATTDLDGTFVLAASNTIGRSDHGGIRDAPVQARGKILFDLSEPALVRFELFDLRGVKIEGGRLEGLSEGSYAWTPGMRGRPRSIYLARIQINDNAYSWHAIHIGEDQASALQASSAVRSTPFLRKNFDSEADTLLVSVEGYETKKLAIYPGVNFDSLTLTSYSYSSDFKNGSYVVKNDTLILRKRALDTLATYCQYWGYAGAPPDSLVKEIIPADTVEMPYWISGDTLHFITERDTCMNRKAFEDDSTMPCLDTTQIEVELVASYSRVEPGLGVDGLWANERHSYRVARGVLDSVTNASYKSLIESDNSYARTWKTANKLLIFKDGKYYERSMAIYDFSHGAFEDWRTCQALIPLNTNAGMQLDSCQYNTSLTILDSVTVQVVGNVSEDSVTIRRLENGDLFLKSSNTIFPESIMKDKPESCPDKISWYLDFLAANKR